jgi:hypothetical protein
LFGLEYLQAVWLIRALRVTIYGAEHGHQQEHHVNRRRVLWSISPDALWEENAIVSKASPSSDESMHGITVLMAKN